MNRLFPALVQSFLFILPSLACAADSGFYVGMGAANGMMIANVNGNGSSFDEKASGFGNGRFIAGYDFNRFVGVEVGASNYGTYKVRDTGSFYVGTVKIDGKSLAVRGGYKFAFGLSVFGKLGMTSMNTEYSPGAIGGNLKRESTGVLFGMGAQYDFTDNLGIRLISEAASFTDGAYEGAVGGLNLIGLLHF